MDCDLVEREEIIEKYLTGRLGAAEREDFEAHGFDCPGCREKLETARIVQEKLWEKGGSIISERRAGVRAGSRRWASASVAAAAVLIVVGALFWLQLGNSGNRPAGEKSGLARFDPPLYLPLTPRGAADEATERFRLGMGYYQDGRYGEAIPDLRAAAAINPRRAGIRFFLGICLLLTGQTDEGAEELRQSILLGESAYLEEAHFYRAKAFLAKGEAAGAKEDLAWVLERGGRLKDEAARILARLR